MLFYILTVIIGVALDFGNQDLGAIKTLRKVYVVWLYIFLCFGYTVGTDWRNYEYEFGFLDGMLNVRWSSEMGFVSVFKLCKKLFVDYWLSVGILKCIYLYTLIRVAKKITPYWLCVIALMITGSVKFVLIDNPLRFMCGLILVNLASEFLLEKKYSWSVAFIFLSFFFHNTCLFFFILFPAILYASSIAKVNKLGLVLLYLLVTFVSSNAIIAEAIRRTMITISHYYSSDIGFYSTYFVDNNASAFSIGSFITAFLFVVIVYTRDYILERDRNASLIYGMTVVYCFLSRLFFLIPTGFRLTIPFALFYFIYVVYLIKSKHLLKWVFILYLSLSFPRDLLTTYKYIPYTNSIPYIITGHMDYYERYWYNIDEYKDRTGKIYNTSF